MRKVLFFVLHIFIGLAALPAFAFAATLTFSPGALTASVGDTFPVSLNVGSSDQAINAVSGTVSFPANLLEVVSIQRAGSVIGFWVQEPAFSNANGQVSFEGVIPNPGFTGAAGKIVSVTFRVKKTGTAELAYQSGSVLANDGLGTEVFSGKGSVTIEIESARVETPAPVLETNETLTVISPTHPDEAKWYSNKSPKFTWVLPQGAREVRTTIGEKASSEPRVSYIPPISSKVVDDLPDGTYYFNMKVRGASGWSTAQFKVSIDTVPPKAFTVRVDSDEVKRESFAVFEARDSLSGIDYFDILIDGTSVKKVDAVGAQQRVLLPNAKEGTSVLTVVAHDKADNVTSAFVTYASFGPEKAKEPVQETAKEKFALPDVALTGAFFYAIAAVATILILASLAFSAWVIWHRMHRTRRALLRSLAATDRRLHEELLEIHAVLRDETLRLKREAKERELSPEEKRFLEQFGKLVDRAKHAINGEFRR